MLYKDGLARNVSQVLCNDRLTRKLFYTWHPSPCPTAAVRTCSPADPHPVPEHRTPVETVELVHSSLQFLSPKAKPTQKNPQCRLDRNVNMMEINTYTIQSQSFRSAGRDPVRSSPLVIVFTGKLRRSNNYLWCFWGFAFQAFLWFISIPFLKYPTLGGGMLETWYWSHNTLP